MENAPDSESFLGRVISGGMWLSGSALAARVLGLFTTVLILRTLSVAEYGTYNLVLAGFGLIASFFISGFDGLVINDLARERGEGRYDRVARLFLEYGAMKAAIGIILFLITFFGSLFLGRWYDRSMIRLLHGISFLFLFFAAERILNLLFETYLKFRAVALFDLTEECAKFFFFIFFVWYLGQGVEGLVRSYMISTGIGVLLFLPYGALLARRLFLHRASRESMLIPLAAGHGKWGIATQYVSEAQRSVMPWLVRIFSGTEAVGLYSLAEGVYSQIVSLFPLANLLGPLIPGEMKNKERMRSVLRYGIKYGTILFSCIGIIGFFAVPALLSRFFPRFVPAVPLFRIMIFALLTTAAANVVNTTLYSYREQKTLFFLVIVRLCFLIVATAALLKIFGLPGAAMSFVATAVFFVAIRYWSLKRVARDIYPRPRDFFRFGAGERAFRARIWAHARAHGRSFAARMKNFFRACWPQILISAVVFAAFSPILFLGKIYFDEEQLGFYYPQSFFFAQSLARGTSLFWNNFYYGGVSVSLDQFVGSFYPLHRVLFLLAPFVAAHHWSIALTVLGGCLFAYWFGRACGLGKSASVILAFAYLTATTFDWLDIGTLAGHAFLIFPAMMLSLVKISRNEKPIGFWFLGGAALGIGLLAGFAQIIFYEYAILFFFAVFLACGGGSAGAAAEAGRKKIIFRRAALGFLGISMLGILIGARQSLPSALFINDTIRSSTLATEKAVVPKPTELLTLVLPEYINLPFFGAGSPGLYAGSLGLLAAIFGMMYYRTALSLFFACLYGLILSFAFRLPMFGWLNDHVPPFSHMSGQFRWLVAGALPLAYLAGHGFEALVRRDWPYQRMRRWSRIMGWGIGLIAALCLAAGAAVYALQTNVLLQQKVVDWRFLGRAKTFSNDYYLHVLRTTLDGIAANFSLVQWRLLAPIALLAASFLIIFFCLRKKISRRTFAVLAIAAAAGNVILIPIAKLRSAYVPSSVLAPEPEIVREIRRREPDPNAYRIAGFLIGDSIFWEILSKKDLAPPEIAGIYRELLINNMNVLYGVQRIDGMEPYRTLRHNQLLDTVLFPKGLSVFDASSSALATVSLRRYVNTDVLKNVGREEKVKDFLSHTPILSMLNVKYVYSLIPLSDPTLRQIAMAPNSFVPVQPYLYENTGVLPRVYVARNPEFVSGRDIDILKKIAAEKDFKKKTFIECGACASEPPGRKSSLSADQYENGFVMASVSGDQAQWLVFGESYMPGWVATVDGVRVPIKRANYIFQAVLVPAGEHRVSFQYHDIIALRWNEFLKKIARR